MRKKLEDYRYLRQRWLTITAEISDLEYAKQTYEPMTLSSVVGGVMKNTTSSPTENSALNNLYFYEQIDKKIEEKKKEKAEIELSLKSIDEYVESIEDTAIKHMVDDRYRSGMTWREVTERANYSPSSWYFVQQKVYSFLNSHIF